MANSVSLVSKFLALIDAVYKLESKTAILDAMTQAPDFLDANQVKVMKLSMVGLGNYSRTTGYPAGDLTAAWETITLTLVLNWTRIGSVSTRHFLESPKSDHQRLSPITRFLQRLMLQAGN